jgi:hypothetical protein
MSPNPGKPGSPDYIAQPAMGEVFDVPNEKIVLRYLNGISEKYDRQYANWLEKGHVSKDDAFVIALNPRNIPFEHADTKPPRVLQAGYTVGPLYAVINRETMDAIGTGYHFRDHIEKTPKQHSAMGREKKEPPKVSTGIFQDNKHNGLSALLCSRVDAANRRGEFGDDFQLARTHTPTCRCPQVFGLEAPTTTLNQSRTGTRSRPWPVLPAFRFYSGRPEIVAPLNKAGHKHRSREIYSPGPKIFS